MENDLVKIFCKAKQIDLHNFSDFSSYCTYRCLSVCQPARVNGFLLYYLSWFWRSAPWNLSQVWYKVKKSCKLFDFLEGPACISYPIDCILSVVTVSKTKRCKLQDLWSTSPQKEWIAKRANDVMTDARQDKQTGMAEIAFFRRASRQYFKTTFLKRKLYLHSLSISHNMLMMPEPRRVPAVNTFVTFPCVTAVTPCVTCSLSIQSIESCSDV